MNKWVKVMGREVYEQEWLMDDMFTVIVNLDDLSLVNPSDRRIAFINGTVFEVSEDTFPLILANLDICEGEDEP